MKALIASVLGVAMVSFGLVGCQKPAEEVAPAQPRAAEQPATEHPTTEHPKAKEPPAEHPKSEHPQ